MIKQLEITTIEKIMQENLAIPNYQRPYKWTAESAVTLFNDIYQGFKENLEEYRIGTVVLHSEDGKYNIVDGQQRLTTISILLYCFYQSPDCSKLLTAKKAFDDLSSKAIIENYKVLRNKLNLLQNTERNKFIEFTMRYCTFVKIVTDSEQEAFQFFDSQNSRGKSLAPHDLLKAYHLREMDSESLETKIKIVANWENTKQSDLKFFFANNLYPLVRYYKPKDALYYSSKDIKVFKGISKKTNSNFSIYHRAANQYIEHLDSEKIKELFADREINQFQLTQPIIAGKRFFLYTLHYFKLIEKVKNHIGKNYSDIIITSGAGNGYIYNLFVNVCMFFADRFSFDDLTEQWLNFFFKWAYSLRLVMYAVYPETINKYALGRHERLNLGINMFSLISEMQNPIELETIVLQDIKESDLTKKYETLYERLKGQNNE